jgi:ABC-type nitrate/sulfonate/bicarbonate transport system substrate-binding protein
MVRRLPSFVSSLSSASVLAVVALTVFACNAPPDSQVAQSSRPLSGTLTWGGPKNVSMLPILADEKGYFKDAGLAARPNYLQTGKIAMDALVSKDLDLAVIVDTNVAFVGFQQGADIRVIASIMEKTDDAIIARRDAGINSPKDLEGKKLAILTGTTSHRFADLFIAANHLDRKKIELINLTPAGIQAGLLKGDLPAGSIWQPFRYNVLQKLGAGAVQFENKGIYRAEVLLAVRGDWLAKNRAAAEAFVKALLRAETFARQDPAGAIGILAPKIGLDPPTLKAIWGEYDLTVRLPSSLVATFDDEASWIKRTQPGFADKAIPVYRDVVTPEVLRQVDPSRIH